jgi:hypothetical protein
MAIDFAAIREDAIRQGMMIDSNTIRARVLGGDTILSERIILAALVKGDHKIRDRILKQVTPEHSAHWLDVEKLVFDWLAESLRSTGQVDETELYQKIEQYVRLKVMPEYTSRLEQVLAIGTPGKEAIDRAIAWLKKSAQVLLPIY